MFKVICIDDLTLTRTIPGATCPQVGDKVTVVEVVDHMGMTMYALAEFPPIGQFELIFDAEAFAPLDGPDEREIIEERLEGAVTMEEQRFEKIWRNVIHQIENK